MTSGRPKIRRKAEVMAMNVYPNLLAEMARTRIPAGKIAEGIGVNPATLSAKMNNKNRLKFAEAAKIRDRFFPEFAIDYLFSQTPMKPIRIDLDTGQDSA